MRDGYVWGRGAIDMKDMDAMMLAFVREWARPDGSRRATSCSPSSPTRRPVGAQGAHWLVDNQPELFADCTEAISEVGGFSVSIEQGSAPLSRPDGGEGARLAAVTGVRAPWPRFDVA